MVTTGWMPYSSSAVPSTGFCEILPGATTNCSISGQPDFSGKAEPIQCGFYTENASRGGSFFNHAGYDNWQCVITPAVPVVAGILKVCKVAGPGVTVGTPIGFTYSSAAGSGTITVPAGPAPGYCVLGPTLPLGTNVTVTENVPSGYYVSNITVAPATQLVPSPPNPNPPSVTVQIGPGVTEVTYTDAASGYLEICKQTPKELSVSGSATFTISPIMPGSPGSYTVPVGACSPAIEVPAGQVIITETSPPSGTATMSCTTIPPSAQLTTPPCNASTWTDTVTVAAGDISTQTIAIITDGRSRNPNGGNNTQ
jgi:hypothetical protein